MFFSVCNLIGQPLGVLPVSNAFKHQSGHCKTRKIEWRDDFKVLSHFLTLLSGGHKIRTGRRKIKTGSHKVRTGSRKIRSGGHICVYFRHHFCIVVAFLDQRWRQKYSDRGVGAFDRGAKMIKICSFQPFHTLFCQIFSDNNLKFPPMGG